MVLQVGAILHLAPGAVQRHFQRLENAVGGEQKQHHAGELEMPLPYQVAFQETGQLTREIVVERQVDRVLRRPRMQYIAAQREHHVTEGEKGQQHAGRNRQGVDVHLRSAQVTGRGPEQLQARAPFGSQMRDQLSE